MAADVTGGHDGAMAGDDVRSSYDAVAAKYEARFVDELRHKPRDRDLLSAFAATVGDPVVDIGCGPGQIGAYVRAQGRRVVGVDLSPAMAALASGRLDAALSADMRSLPFVSGGVGGVLAFYSLVHVPRPQLAATLSEIGRVLRPAGRVLLSAHQGRGEVQVDEFLDEPVSVAFTFFELDELVDACRAAGLVVERAERREPYEGESSTIRLYVEATRPDKPAPG